MGTEFNLSDEIKGFGRFRRLVWQGYYEEEDVKEFIKKLKENFNRCFITETDKELAELNIDKLAGDKLI